MSPVGGQSKIAGSIALVEAVVAGRAEPGRFRILPIKYVGGLLSLGSGLALGREGPSVQMGGSIAIIVASATRRSQADLRVLAAAGVKVYNTDAPTVADALARYRAGQLAEATAANVESHWA